MKNKPLEMCLLFDFYGEMLTEKQKETFDLYYNEDLSLAEISEHVGITRQGVRDIIVRAERTLELTRLSVPCWKTSTGCALLTPTSSIIQKSRVCLPVWSII